jgi:hypothetical protein
MPPIPAALDNRSNNSNFIAFLLFRTKSIVFDLNPVI